MKCSRTMHISHVHPRISASSIPMPWPSTWNDVIYSVCYILYAYVSLSHLTSLWSQRGAGLTHSLFSLCVKVVDTEWSFKTKQSCPWRRKIIIIKRNSTLFLHLLGSRRTGSVLSVSGAVQVGDSRFPKTPGAARSYCLVQPRPSMQRVFIHTRSER